MNFKKILVVCAGNICRSPMGEAFFKQALAEKGYTIDSAGIVGLVNHPADDKAIKVMADIGIDISEHRGKRLNDKLIADFDLILVMTQRQVHEMGKQWPFSRGRVFRIGHWLNLDVADPYRLDESVFLEARENIQQSVDEWIKKLDNTN